MSRSGRYSTGIAIVGLMLSSCVASPPDDPNLIGWITADGPFGYRNQQLVQDGVRTPIYNNDHVSTGAATGMRIDLRNQPGSYAQLDENTDPDLLQEAGCLWIRLIKGQIFAQGTGLCLGSPDLAAALNSQVVLSIQPTKGSAATRSVLRVIE